MHLHSFTSELQPHWSSLTRSSCMFSRASIGGAISNGIPHVDVINGISERQLSDVPPFGIFYLSFPSLQTWWKWREGGGCGGRGDLTEAYCHKLRPEQVWKIHHMKICVSAKCLKAFYGLTCHWIFVLRLYSKVEKSRDFRRVRSATVNSMRKYEFEGKWVHSIHQAPLSRCFHVVWLSSVTLGSGGTGGSSG